jgi:hypothetical protein
MDLSSAESQVSLIEFTIVNGKKIGRYRQIELYAIHLKGSQLKQLKERIKWQTIKPRVREKQLKNDFILLVGLRKDKLFQYMAVRITTKKNGCYLYFLLDTQYGRLGTGFC